MIALTGYVKLTINSKPVFNDSLVQSVTHSFSKKKTLSI